MNTIDNYDFRGKRAIIRVDFNVPLDDKGNVTDDTRIRAAIPTIRKVLEGGGSVILMSHLGRPKKNNDEKYSLRPIVPAIEKLLGHPVVFAGDSMGERAAELARALRPGEVLLLENLRFYAEEEGKPRGLADDARTNRKPRRRRPSRRARRSSSSAWHRMPTSISTTRSERRTGLMPPRRSSRTISPATRCSVMSWRTNSRR